MKSFSFKYGLVDVSVTLPGRINTVDGDSGTGKTFLYTILSKAGIEGFDVLGINYSNHKLLSKLDVSKLDATNLVILDNADMYLTKELVNSILLSKAVFIVFTRNCIYFTRKNSCVCKVIYDNKRLCMRGDCDEDYLRG